MQSSVQHVHELVDRQVKDSGIDNMDLESVVDDLKGQCGSRLRHLRGIGWLIPDPTAREQTADSCRQLDRLLPSSRPGRVRGQPQW